MVRQDALAPAAGVLLGVLLFWRLWDGTARFLVQGWYLPVLLISAAGLVLLGVTALVRRGPHGPRVGVSGAGAIASVLVALPLALGVAFQPEPLGTRSLEDDPLAVRQFSASAASNGRGLRNIYQWAYEFQTVEPAVIAGAPVEIVGFVYHKESDSGERFHIARFVVACCVADAQGFALPVQWKDAATLQDDRWVRLKGRVATDAAGEAVILANEIEEIDAPSNPYIYP